MIKETSF